MESIIHFFTFEDILKLIIAATLSLIIGIERELKRKPVGLKTSIVIATFSCMLTLLSIKTAYNTPPRDDINITMDPLRLAAQIVSGIGFLGAGVILRKGHDSITGLTTAAMIWGAAGIGIAVGAGFYLDALAAVLIVVFGVEVVAPLFSKFGPKRLRMREVFLKAELEHKNNLNQLLDYMKRHDMLVDNIRICDIENSIHEVEIRFSCPHSIDTITIYNKLHTLVYIKGLEIESVNIG